MPVNQRLFLRTLGLPALFASNGDPIRFRVKKHIALLVYLGVEQRARQCDPHECDAQRADQLHARHAGRLQQPWCQGGRRHAAAPRHRVHQIEQRGKGVAEAYAAGKSANVALYSTDSEYHSGKYFVSSDTGDWNAEGRPTLMVRWAD